VIELAYLTKGLFKLGKLYKPGNKSLERKLRGEIVRACLAVFDEQKERFDPYSMAKLMKYVSKDDSQLDRDTLRLYSLFGKQLITTIEQRQISLIDADLDDPLVDLEMHDVLDFVRVFSVLASNQV